MADPFDMKDDEAAADTDMGHARLGRRPAHAMQDEQPRLTFGRA